jgi:ADP-ribosyl-[dinitrogen reductase] hydrolase
MSVCLVFKVHMPTLEDQFRGVVIGTAVGDAIGLPREGLNRRRAARMFGGQPLAHRLVFGRGMVSDDTEHTCMVAQSLLASGGDPSAFARSLAWRLRWWLLAFPAGVGMATAKACIKLWLGFPPSRSGVWSAGNGPAMRAAILGVYAWNDLERLGQLIAASTRLTHTDPAAESGALAVALAAAYAVAQRQDDAPTDPEGYLRFARPHLAGTETLELIEDVVRRLRDQTSFDQYLADRGLTQGVSGYINHTVPACLFCWLTWPTDFRMAVEQIVIAGGDADSTGAIVGGFVGISAGRDAIPEAWVDGLMEWPRSAAWMEQLADRLATHCQSTPGRAGPLPLLWPAVVLRNLFFLGVVIVHGVRRLLPPY